MPKGKEKNEAYRFKRKSKAIFGQRHVIYVENPKASTNNRTTKMSYQGQVIASLYENQFFSLYWQSLMCHAKFLTLSPTCSSKLPDHLKEKIEVFR